jgi:predicted N-acetyltransferase YhbS
VADKERDEMLREMARHRGFKLVKSRRRKAGGDFGKYGLADAKSGKQCFGFGAKGLEASDTDIEAYLRKAEASTWKSSLSAVRASAKKAKPKARDETPAAPPPPPPAPKKPEKPEPPPKPVLRIRPADAVDAEAIAGLISGDFEASEDEISDRLPILSRTGEPPLLAKLGNEVVGVITWHVMHVLHRPQPVGRISFLEVTEEARKQGIGRALVEAAEARIAEKGCGLIEVTSNEKLKAAHKFYGRLGFERTSFRFARAVRNVKG